MSFIRRKKLANFVHMLKLPKYLLILFFTTVSVTAKADLRPNCLSIKLTCENSEVANGQQILFWLEFTNKDLGTRPTLLPGNRKSGKKIIYFSFFSVKNDFYTEVFRESVEITIDTSSRGGTDFRYLEAGETFRIPVFFNDSKNFDSHIEAHHRLPELTAGEYQVLAWYQPWNDDLAQYAFNPIDPFGHSSEENYDTTKLDLSFDGTQSNYLRLSIVNYFSVSSIFVNTEFCPLDCKFCAAIEKGNWTKVSAIIDGQTYYKGPTNVTDLDSAWRMPHRNVTWLGPNPQAILASLPTFTGRTMIFSTPSGYQYYYLSWQLGEIYKTRSRMSQIFYWMGFNRTPIKTSEVDYCKLVNFSPY